VHLLLWFGAVAGAAWLLNLVGRFLGSWTIYVLYLLPVIAAVILGFGIRITTTDADVNFERESVGLGDNKKRLIDRFQLGRLDYIFSVNTLSVFGMFLAMTFGFQAGLLYYLPNHAGLDIDGSLYECCLITADNCCHGIFLDTFELYGLHIGDPVDHTVGSATVFYAFRLAFDALVALLVIAAFKRVWMRLLLRQWPQEPITPQLLDEFIYQISSDSWYARPYHDEVLFLVMAKWYIHGKADQVWALTSQLSSLNVHDDVRCLFTDQYGRTMFGHDRDRDR
jgi:hypothetical protein